MTFFLINMFCPLKSFPLKSRESPSFGRPGAVCRCKLRQFSLNAPTQVAKRTWLHILCQRGGQTRGKGVYIFFQAGYKYRIAETTVRW